MLINEIVYFLVFLIFIISIFILIYTKKNKNKNVCKYITILSIIYIIYLALDVLYLPLYLNLDIGLEMIFLEGVLCCTIILLIISIIITNIKVKKLESFDDRKNYKIIFIVLIILPIIVFTFSYFREIYYINNSKLILVCSSGDGFNEKDFAYAINDNYCKKISIGTDFRGYRMIEYLPKGFKELNYTWTSDKVEIDNDNNRIIIYRNNEIIYEGKLNSKISNYDIEEVFYK